MYLLHLSHEGQWRNAVHKCLKVQVLESCTSCQKSLTAGQSLKMFLHLARLSHGTGTNTADFPASQTIIMGTEKGRDVAG